MGHFDNYTREQLESELWFYKCLQFGMEFQDYMTIQLCKLGINLNNFCSKKYQMKYGENLKGIEIKHDKGIKEFGNIYIEVSAINKNGDEMIKGGATYEDNDKYYLVGDETECFIFKKSRLKGLYKHLLDHEEDYIKNGICLKEHRDNGKITSQGIIIPVKLAKHFYYRHYTYEELKL